MNKRSIPIILQFVCFGLFSLSATRKPVKPVPVTLQEMADRLSRFGNNIPQEKVYVHMDNTSYCLGDTIWFKAYVSQTNTGTPSSLSGVLYAELFNNDGYLMERKIVETVKGQGHGFFALPLNAHTYAGFYELRVYSRWQLNWGVCVRPHSKYTEGWFFNKTASNDYFRDYEKLYSRVFPVYDHMDEAEQAEGAAPNMSLRILRRYFSQDKDSPKPTLSLFPEGGELQEGVPCRVAFEAVMSDGEYLKGHLKVGDNTYPVTHRGRGVFEITPGKDNIKDVEFISEKGISLRQSLPKARRMGASLRMNQEKEGWSAQIDLSEDLKAGDFGITFMHQGVLLRFDSLQHTHTKITLPMSALQPGVNQATVFDRNGRIWADRLFFVSDISRRSSSTSCAGGDALYRPQEAINLTLEAKEAANEVISISVRDANRAEPSYDSGNILTEMLLCSEIKGFVPQPEWYFAKDDEEHRNALDLLMMTQGWRRFKWQEMALKDGMELIQPLEQRTPILMGAVHTYRGYTSAKSNRNLHSISSVEWMMGIPKEMLSINTAAPYDERGVRNFKGKDLKRSKSVMDGEKLRKEVKVYARFLDELGTNGVEGEAATCNGQFRIFSPRFEGECQLRIAARDTTNRNFKFTWKPLYQDKGYAPYYVRLQHPYPHHVNPFHHYQILRPQKITSSPVMVQDESLDPEVRQMEQVFVYAKHGGLIGKRFEKPAIVMCAYDAFNDASDAGLVEACAGPLDYIVEAIAKNLVGDMNTGERYKVYGTIPNDDNLQGLRIVDSVYLFTDFAPRLQGYKRYMQSDRPDVGVYLVRHRDKAVSEASKDRLIRQKGFASPGEFYHPDYSKHKPTGQADYRRTLYWNPMLKLDDAGKTQVNLYNNSSGSKISIEVEGLTQQGKFIHYSN